MKKASQMMTEESPQALDELEAYYQSKLDAVRAKRQGKSSRGTDSHRQEPVHLRLDPRKRELIVKWEE